MTYRKVGIIGLIIVLSLICVQRIHVYKQMDRFASYEQALKNKWKGKHPVMCPSTHFCSLESELANFHHEKELDIALYEDQFKFLCFLLTPFFFCLFIKKKE